MNQRLQTGQRLGQRQLPLQDIILFQNLIGANMQRLEQVLKQEAKECIFIEVVPGGELPEMSSIDSLIQEGDSVEFGDRFSQQQDDLGYRMKGDGPAYNNEIPDDRKRHLATYESGAEDLFKQIDLLDLSDSDKKIGKIFIQSIEDNGLLPNAQGIMEIICKHEGLLMSNVDRVYQILKSKLVPAGILAESYTESLAIQVERDPTHSIKRDATLHIIQNHYQDFINRDYASLSQKMNLNTGDVNAKVFLDEVYGYITKFNPVPKGYEFNAQNSRSAEPDLLIHEFDGVFTAKVNKRALPSIQVNKEYLKELEIATGGKLSEESIYIQERNKGLKLEVMIQDRNELLEKVTSHILNAQKHYISTENKNEILPLLMKEVSEKYGLSESTISKSVKDKVVRMDDGREFKLSEFFDLGVVNKLQTIRVPKKDLIDQIKTAVLNEKTVSPVTDIDIEKSFKSQGFAISTAFVKRLREAAGLPDAKSRLVLYQSNDKEDLHQQWGFSDPIEVQVGKSQSL